MTRARALKSIIRARAEKTGERYTTARRQVLKTLSTRSAAASPIAEPDPPPPAAVAPASPAPAAPTAATSKGGLSDARAIARTGRALAHWFDVLDRFGAVERGHTAAARHLHDDHGVDGWYAQGITVAYERARGLRAVNQRRSGSYEVSVSKVVAADTAGVAGAFTNPRQRARWIAQADPDLRGALVASLRGRTGAFVVKPNGRARHRYTWDGTTVEIYLDPKGPQKCSLVVQHMKLPSQAAVDERRAQWRSALAACAAHFGAR
jgi:hypothetical protein